MQNITVDRKKILSLCRRWKIVEFAVFGSVLRKDFRSTSDIDILVSFSKKAKWSLEDLVEIQDELEHIFGREVDIIEEAAIRNPFRRHEILTTKEVLYAV